MITAVSWALLTLKAEPSLQRRKLQHEPLPHSHGRDLSSLRLAALPVLCPGWRNGLHPIVRNPMANRGIHRNKTEIPSCPSDDITFPTLAGMSLAFRPLSVLLAAGPRQTAHVSISKPLYFGRLRIMARVPQHPWAYSALRQ